MNLKKKKSQKLILYEQPQSSCCGILRKFVGIPSAIIKHIQLHTKDIHWIATAILTNSTKAASKPGNRIFPIDCPQDSEARCPPINIWLNFRRAPRTPLSFDFGICPVGHTWLKFSWFQSSQKSPPWCLIKFHISHHSPSDIWSPLPIFNKNPADLFNWNLP